MITPGPVGLFCCRFCTGQGVNLANVDRLMIGLDTKSNMTIDGGSGRMYFDDNLLNQP